MKYRVVTLTVLLAFVALLPLAAVAQQPNRGLTVPTTVDGLPATFTIQSFAAQGTELVAVGVLAVQTATGVQTGRIAVPVTAISGTCDILHLELGPLTLDLLGLQVHLAKIVLDIDAQAGAGNLLGNLLCAIANLLNPPGPLAQLANLLNQLLALLG